MNDAAPFSPRSQQATEILEDTPATAPAEGADLSSEALFRGARVIRIQHGDEVYQLRTTKLGKLILTK